MIVDVHTQSGSAPAIWARASSPMRRRSRAMVISDIAVDLDRHWEAMQAVDRAVVLGFRARHVGVLVPNEYVAEYVARHPERLIGFCSVDPAGSRRRRATRLCCPDSAITGAEDGAHLPECRGHGPALSPHPQARRTAPYPAADSPGHHLLLRCFARAWPTRSSFSRWPSSFHAWSW